MPNKPIERDQQQRYRQHRRGQHQYDRRRVKRPQEQWQAIPGQPRRAQPVNSDDEIQAGEDR